MASFALWMLGSRWNAMGATQNIIDNIVQGSVVGYWMRQGMRGVRSELGREATTMARTRCGMGENGLLAALWGAGIRWDATLGCRWR
jgi:hypothetical protein